MLLLQDEKMTETFILDFGSGNTCKNDGEYIKRMIKELAAVDLKRKTIIKWQLFESAGDNIPLKKMYFEYAYRFAQKLGFKTTASVFDIQSLKFLLTFDIPFVKIANRSDLYWLAGEVPRRITVIFSVDKNDLDLKNVGYDFIWCLSEYPSTAEDYIKAYGDKLACGVSDHTANWDLFNKYKPNIYECHYKLKDSTGLDAGHFARTPEQIKEIIGGL